MKKCSKCNEEKPLGAFPRNGRGGHRADCKVCHSATVKAIYARDPEKHRARNRERMNAAYREDPEKFKARAQSYRKANPEKHRAQAAAWAAAHPEQAKLIKQRWAKAHPENSRDRVRTRRARRLAAFVADVRFDDILRRDLGICGICLQPIMDNLIELDHVLPLVAGGTHEPDNVQLAHRACNRRKHAKVDFTLAL